MKKNIMYQFCLTFLFSSFVIAQTDTSSYFPLGLWGIWVDPMYAPFNHKSLSKENWDTETDNWKKINANYMVGWIPEWVEDTVMTITEPLGYKIDIARSTLDKMEMENKSLQQ